MVIHRGTRDLPHTAAVADLVYNKLDYAETIVRGKVALGGGLFGIGAAASRAARA